MAREIVVVSAVRRAIGAFGKSLSDVPPPELGAFVMHEAVRRSCFREVTLDKWISAVSCIPNQETIGDFAKLTSLIARQRGTVTAGNASGIYDGAAAVVLMEGSRAERCRRTVGAARNLCAWRSRPAHDRHSVRSLQRNRPCCGRTSRSGIDVIETNDAFATQASAWLKN